MKQTLMGGPYDGMIVDLLTPDDVLLTPSRPNATRTSQRSGVEFSYAIYRRVSYTELRFDRVVACDPQKPMSVDPPE